MGDLNGDIRDNGATEEALDIPGGVAREVHDDNAAGMTGEGAPGVARGATGGGGRTVRVLLVDDERLMRAGLRLLVDGADGVEVVGEAGDGREALDAVASLDPDVVLMDIRMPGMDGIDATRALLESDSRARVVVLTAFDTDTFLLDALRAGAVSFLLKDSPPETVVQAIHDAAAGRSTFSPAVLARLVALAATREAAETPPPERGAPTGVTDREWDVARLVAQGSTNSEIAAALFLSVPTVKTHVGHLFDKLGVTNRVQLAIRVLEAEA